MVERSDYRVVNIFYWFLPLTLGLGLLFIESNIFQPHDQLDQLNIGLWDG
ncbi:MAG: hypothetical protein ACFFAU_19545 [Candidatus Hodarchaeota archaeon]